MLEDERTGALAVAYLTVAERQKLRCVCRRWHFTCAWLQYADGAAALSKKSPLNLTSRRFQHVWTHFVKDKSAELLKLLVQALPELSKEDTYALKMGLCDSTNTGIRPSFDNAQARTGYIVDKMNRCGNFPGLLLTREMSSVRSELFATSSTKKEWQVALYGGGPGYDSIGIAYLLDFLRADDISVHTNVYDNEPGWEDAVISVAHGLQSLGYTNSTWEFKGCDITEAVESSVNCAVGSDIPSTDLFVFSFVCVENFRLLRNTDFVFLRSLFASAHTGCYFVFMDSTHRLWPVIWGIARQTATFRIWIPHVRGCHYVLVLQKLREYEDPAGFPFYDQAMAKLATFSTHLNQQLQYLGLVDKS